MRRTGEEVTMGRRLGLTAARGAALCVSIGLVAVMMVRASAGCSDRSEIGADPARSKPETSAPSAREAGAEAAAAAVTSESTPPASAAPSVQQEEEMYFPASKSMGGEGRRLVKPQPPPQQN